MPTILDFLNSSETALRAQPPVEDLRIMRDRLESYAFLRECEQFVRQANDPGVIGDFSDTCSRIASELQVQRNLLMEKREQSRIIGIGGGIGLATGGVVAALGLAFPLLAIAPVGGGLYMMWRAQNNALAKTERVTLIDQVRDAILAVKGRCS